MREVEQDWGQAGEVWDADEGDGKERRVDSEGRMPSAPTPPPGSVGGWSDMSGW